MANNLEVLISLGFVADEVKSLDDVLKKLKEIDEKKDKITAKEVKVKEGESKGSREQTLQTKAMEKIFKENMPDKEDKTFINEIAQLRQDFGATFNQLMIKGIFPFASNPVQAQSYLGMYSDAGSYIQRYLEGKKNRFDVDTEKSMVDQFTPVVQNAIKTAADMLNKGIDPGQNRELGNILANLDLLKTGAGTSGYNAQLFTHLISMLNELSYQGKITGRYLTSTQDIKGLENSTLFTQVTRYNPEYTSPSVLTPDMKKIKDTYEQATERQLSASAIEELNKKIMDYEGGKGSLEANDIRAILPLIREGESWVKQTRATPLNVSKDIYDKLVRPAQTQELSSLGLGEQSVTQITMEQLMVFTRPDEAMLFPKEVAKKLQEKGSDERKTLMDYLKMKGGSDEYLEGQARMLESKEFAESIKASGEMVYVNTPFGRYSTETKQVSEAGKNLNTMQLMAPAGQQGNIVPIPQENIVPTQIETKKQLGDAERILAGEISKLSSEVVTNNSEIDKLMEKVNELMTLIKNKQTRMN